MCRSSFCDVILFKKTLQQSFDSSFHAACLCKIEVPEVMREKFGWKSLAIVTKNSISINDIRPQICIWCFNYRTGSVSYNIAPLLTRMVIVSIAFYKCVFMVSRRKRTPYSPYSLGWYVLLLNDYGFTKVQPA